MVSAGGAMASASDPRAIFEAGERANIPALVLDKIVDAMSSSITLAFALALMPIALAAITVLLMGSARVEVTKKNSKDSEQLQPAPGH